MSLERYYGANASTFIGVAMVALSVVSVISSIAAKVPVIEVAHSNEWSILAAGVGVVAGVMLVKSQETIGGLMAIALVISLLANGVSINLYQFLNVGSAAYHGVRSGVSAIGQTNMSASPSGGDSGVGQNAMFSGFVRGQALTPAQAKECQDGVKQWTKTMAGARNCTTGYVWKKDKNA